MNSVTEETLTAHVAEINESVIRLSGQIAEEEDRQARWKVENQRRRHNYVPLIFDVLTMLSKKNMLEGMFKDAIERKKQKTEAKKQSQRV
jgi:ubiquitin carboxyl-terminal hydrolase L5